MWKGAVFLAARKKADSFEQQLHRLEELVTLMEQGGLSLEDMIKHYEEGSALQQSLQKQLEDAKGRLAELAPKGSGDIRQADIQEVRGQ